MIPSLSQRRTSVLDCVAAALVLEGREIETTFHIDAIGPLPPIRTNKSIDGFMSPCFLFAYGTLENAPALRLDDVRHSSQH
jgi:hypothetical protein